MKFPLDHSLFTFCCMASTFSCLAFSFGCMWLSTWPLLFPCTPFFSCLRPHGLYFSSLHFTLVCCMIQSFVRPRPTSSGSRFRFCLPVSVPICLPVPVPICLPVPVPVLLAGRFRFACRFWFRFCLPVPFSGFAYQPVSGFREFGHHHPSRQSGQSALSTNEKWGISMCIYSQGLNLPIYVG